MKDFHTDALTVGIAGTGAMGRGIAQIAVQGGAQVLLYDAMDGAAQKARDYISGMLAKGYAAEFAAATLLDHSAAGPVGEVLAGRAWVDA